MNGDTLTGRTIAGYHLTKYVGEGGTATVYRAEHPERGVAAVKILRSRLAQDPVAVKRFLREAEYGSRVSHPNIVRTYDYGQAEGLHYLALEWADGEPLAEFVSRSGPLAPALVAKIVEQIGAPPLIKRGSFIAISSPRTSCTTPRSKLPSCSTSVLRETRT
jgi:serine/threonine-protein kinase